MADFHGYPGSAHPLLADPAAPGQLKNVTINLPPASALPPALGDLVNEVQRLKVADTAARAELHALLHTVRLQQADAGDKRAMAAAIRAGATENPGAPNRDQLRADINEALGKAQALNAALHSAVAEYTQAMVAGAADALVHTRAAFDKSEKAYTKALEQVADRRRAWSTDRAMVAFWHALVADPGMRPSVSGVGGFAVNGRRVSEGVEGLEEVAQTRRILDGEARKVNTVPGFADHVSA